MFWLLLFVEFFFFRWWKENSSVLISASSLNSNIDIKKNPKQRKKGTVLRLPDSFCCSLYFTRIFTLHTATPPPPPPPPPPPFHFQPASIDQQQQAHQGCLRTHTQSAIQPQPFHLRRQIAPPKSWEMGGGGGGGGKECNARKGDPIKPIHFPQLISTTFFLSLLWRHWVNMSVVIHWRGNHLLSMANKNSIVWALENHCIENTPVTYQQFDCIVSYTVYKNNNCKKHSEWTP